MESSSRTAFPAAEYAAAASRGVSLCATSERARRRDDCWARACRWSLRLGQVAQHRTGESIDFAVARAFIASIPMGRWTSYGDVAAAAGAPKVGQALGIWLAHNELDVPLLPYRVIKADGRVSEGYRAVDWPGLPATPADVQTRLTDEGVKFGSDGRASQRQRWTPADFRSTK